MEVVSAFDAKTHLSALLHDVEHGNEITITRHGRPVARLVPVRESTGSALEALMNIGQFRSSIASAVNVIELRDEGRKHL